ncbi:MAG: hypothetical protein U0K86_05915 [Agathobacter sp.]|nr:hypothetical protein [Agathobacter sp.]
MKRHTVLKIMNPYGIKRFLIGPVMSDYRSSSIISVSNLMNGRVVYGVD